MSYTDIMSHLVIIIGLLVVLVNIVTEVAKKVYEFKTTQSLNIFVTILSLIVTVVSFMAYWQLNRLTLEWYIVAAFFVVGFMVAYAAMFGFDKLLKYLEQVKE